MDNWRSFLKTTEVDKSHKNHNTLSGNSKKPAFVPFDHFVRPELIETPMGTVAFKDIERVFGIDPLWERFKDDSRWLNHLAETLIRWREDGTC